MCYVRNAGSHNLGITEKIRKLDEEFSRVPINRIVFKDLSV